MYRYYSGKCQIMKYLCYVLHRQAFIAFTETEVSSKQCMKWWDAYKTNAFLFPRMY